MEKLTSTLPISNREPGRVIDERAPPAPASVTGCLRLWAERYRIRQLAMFCAVGGSGVVIDMLLLGILSHPDCFGWSVTASKVGAAETALLSNFVWNEAWTFHEMAQKDSGCSRVLRRLLNFHGICGIGIVIAVLLLNILHGQLGWSLYFANFCAIGVATIWNFGMNAAFNWKPKDGGECPREKARIATAHGRTNS